MAVKEIRVLSVQQPYADHIVFGDKWNELRTWATPYRGQFFVHASRWDGSKFQETPGEGTTGAIIGRVELLDCRPEEEMWEVFKHLECRRKVRTDLAELANLIKPLPQSGWDHGVAKWNWVLGNPQVLAEPIPMMGKLNLWHASVDEAALVFRDHRDPLTSRPERKRSKSGGNGKPKKKRRQKLYIPAGRSARHLYNYLKKRKDHTANLTPGVLQSFADKLNTSVSDLYAALENHPVFEKVSEDSSPNDFWRVHVVEETE